MTCARARPAGLSSMKGEDRRGMSKVYEDP